MMSTRRGVVDVLGRLPCTAKGPKKSTSPARPVMVMARLASSVVVDAAAGVGGSVAPGVVDV